MPIVPSRTGVRPRICWRKSKRTAEGGYSQLTAFIREWGGREGKALRAFVPLKFVLGEAFQFDWSEEGLVVGGIYRRLQVSHLKLCASPVRSGWWPTFSQTGGALLSTNALSEGQANRSWYCA